MWYVLIIVINNSVDVVGVFIARREGIQENRMKREKKGRKYQGLRIL